MKYFNVILSFVINNIINLFVMLANIIVWRKKNIWIIGAWFGNKYADNSRYLYQYLFENKEKYNIRRVIWITRSDEVYSKLKKNNYDVLKLHSFKSLYYHLKSGVHVLCNNAYSSAKKHDINTFLSFGAKKIQLWHGAGIKACGRLVNKKNTFLTRFYYNFLFRYGQPGMWGRCYQIAVSHENARVIIDDFAIMKKRVIMAYYPRDCEFSPFLFDDEKEIVELIKEKRKNNKIILYLPTFKNNTRDFIFPEKINGFEQFLLKNDYVWIQKPHSVDNYFVSTNYEFENFIVLNSDFDINVLLDYVDLVISDYSSVTTDAIAKNIKTLDYCPDYEYYMNEDRGFVSEYEKYHIGEKIIEPCKLFDAITERLNEDFVNTKSYEQTKTFLLGDKKWTMEKVVIEIIAAINAK